MRSYQVITAYYLICTSINLIYASIDRAFFPIFIPSTHPNCALHITYRYVLTPPSPHTINRLSYLFWYINSTEFFGCIAESEDLLPQVRKVKVIEGVGISGRLVDR